MPTTEIQKTTEIQRTTSGDTTTEVHKSTEIHKTPEPTSTPSASPWPPSTQELFTELYFNAALETDRQLLTLSAGGLGLLLTLLTTKGAANGWILALYGLSALLFLANIFALIKILDLNKTYIADVASKGHHLCKLLSTLDKLVRRLFIAASAAAIILAIVIGLQSTDKGKEKVAEENKPSQTSQLMLVAESVDGIAIPVQMTKSANGIGNVLAPASTSGAQQPIQASGDLGALLAQLGSSPQK